MGSFARFEVSQRGLPGQLIFTGSAVPPNTSEITHSETGRFAWLTMRPMSLWESEDSTGAVSLGELFQGKVESGSGQRPFIGTIGLLTL